MKHFFYWFAGLFLFFGSSNILAQDEPQAIREVIKEAYVDGLFNEGNLRNVELGFSEDFRMTGIQENGELLIWDLEKWKAVVQQNQTSGKYPPSKENEVSVKYLDISVQGNTAVVKLEFMKGKNLVYVDFLTLNKFSGGWKIVAKAYEKLPPKKAPR